MPRVVAGYLKSRRILTPKTNQTRPTSDKVREALFSRLDNLNRIVDTNVLDLFAGSGALGIEALSRGARHCVFVEQARPVVGVIRENIKELELEENTTVHACSAQNALARINDMCFDLVFIDPPYALKTNDVEKLINELTQRGQLNPDALVIVERDRRSPEIKWNAGFSDDSKYEYSDTVIYQAYWDGEMQESV